MEVLKVYDDPQTFWYEASPHLKKEESKNSLILGMSNIFRSEPKDCVYQSALFRGDLLRGAIVCSRYRTNTNFLPSPVSNVDDALKLFTQFKSNNISITGIIGELSTANYYRKLFEIEGLKTKIHLRQGIYSCNKVIEPKTERGIVFRKAEAKDVSKIGEWINLFHHEAVPHDPPVNGFDLAETKISKNMVYVLERDGELVSMAGWNRDIGSSCSISLVFTPKHLRKNGYASVVTAELTNYFLNNGKKEITLYTDMSNPTSNKIYQNIGYKLVCDSIHLGVYSLT